MPGSQRRCLRGGRSITAGRELPRFSADPEMIRRRPNQQLARLEAFLHPLGLGLGDLYMLVAGDWTAWLGWEDSNSEMSSQNIPLKGRADFRGSYIRCSNFVRIAAISSLNFRRHFLSRARTSSVVGSSPDSMR